MGAAYVQVLDVRGPQPRASDECDDERFILYGVAYGDPNGAAPEPDGSRSDSSASR